MEIEPIYLFDNKKELIDIVPVEQLIDSYQDWTLNGLIKSSVAGVYSEVIEQAHYYGTRDIDEPDVFWQYKIISYTKQDNLFSFEGIYVLFDDLSGRGIVKDKRPNKAHTTEVLGYILDGTGWQIGNVYSSKKATSNHYYVSKLEAFWDFIEKWRVEFKPRMTYSGGKVTGKYIDIYDKVSDDFGKWYEYGDSLLSVEAEEMRESVFTAFVGRGKGEEVGDGFGRKIGFKDVVWTTRAGKPVNKPINQDYVEIPWATALYGYEDGTPRMTIVDFPDIEDPAELLDATYEYALTECRPKVQFKSHVLETERADVGEIVTIIRDDIGIRYKTRIFNLKRNFLNKKVKTIQFGEQLVQSRSQSAKKTATAIKKQEEQTLNWLLAIRQALTDSYFNEDGYNYELEAGNDYGLPGGYYSFNRPIDQDPSKVVYVGAGKVLLANSKNPDGSWIWRTAMDGDGIVADEINTGKLKASLIQSGFNEIAAGTHMTEDGFEAIGPNGEVAKININASILSAAGGLDQSQAYLRSGRLYFRDTDGVATLNIGAHPIIGEGKERGSLAVAKAEKLVIGRFEDYLNINTKARVIPYLSLEYAVTQGDDSTGYIKAHKELSMSGKAIRDVQALSGYELFVRSTFGKLMLGVVEANKNYNTIEVGYANAKFNGNIEFAPGYEVKTTSDKRLKNIIGKTKTKGLEELRKLNVVDYTWKNGDFEEQIGLIAQDTPFLSTKTSDGNYALLGNKHTMLLTVAMQELDKELNETKQELADLKALLTDKGVI